MRGYLASISYVDHQVGRLLDALDRSKLKENTIVVLWTDHGFHIGEKENWEKFALWQQTTRVPLFIRAPGKSLDGQRCNQAVSLIDLYPTLCELAGIETPAQLGGEQCGGEQCDGESLVPYLIDPKRPKSTPALTSFQFPGEPTPSHAVATKRYRYIRYGNGLEELYDHKTDPDEFKNIAAEVKWKETKSALSRFLPKAPAAQVKIPVESPYNRRRNKTLIANRNLQIDLKISRPQNAKDGVLICHGGDFHGFSVYLKNGLPHFAIRHNKVMVVAKSENPLPIGESHLKAILTKSGMMQLWVNDKSVAQRKAPGPILIEPTEGRWVGRDEKTPVGDYIVPFRFSGKVLESKVQIIRQANQK